MTFRLADPSEYPAIGRLIAESFEPITWFKEVDARFGPLNGCDWKQRWQHRLEEVFEREIILVGEANGVLSAAAAGTYDPRAALGFIDLLAVDRRRQGSGYGRLMLRAMADHFRSLGARHAYLDCLAANEPAMSLYRSEGWTEMAPHVKWFVRL
jgi:GNAT superfamily N-acetyltransferase